jgi:thioredoxin-like negative regulator of GroEL
VRARCSTLEEAAGEDDDIAELLRDAQGDPSEVEARVRGARAQLPNGRRVGRRALRTAAY